MLSDETATSNKFLKIINWLKDFNKTHEKHGTNIQSVKNQ